MIKFKSLKIYEHIRIGFHLAELKIKNLNLNYRNFQCLNIFAIRINVL